MCSKEKLGKHLKQNNYVLHVSVSFLVPAPWFEDQAGQENHGLIVSHFPIKAEPIPPRSLAPPPRLYNQHCCRAMFYNMSRTMDPFSLCKLTKWSSVMYLTALLLTFESTHIIGGDYTRQAAQLWPIFPLMNENV